MNLFKRWNSKAKSRPKFINDFTPLIQHNTERDATTNACINLIANSIAGLPFGVYKKTSHQKVSHPIYDLLSDPNAEEKHTLFFQNMVKDFFSGNVFLLLYKDNETGEVSNLFRLNPSDVSITRNEFNQKVFHYKGQTYNSDRILHIPSPWNYDGTRGYSIFEVCRKTFDSAYSLDDWTQNNFSNNLGKRLVIDIGKARQDIDEKTEKEIVSRFLQNYSGTKNASKPILKKDGVEFSVIDSGIADANSMQLQQNREFTQKVISEIFGVPVGYLNGDFSDIESITTLYSMNAIQPITDTFQEYFQNLFRIEDRGKYYIKFNFNSLLKTSLANKINSFTQQLNNGQLTPNEIRRMSEMPEIEGGDYLYRNSALLPIREDIESSLAASAKQKQQELTEQATHTEKNSEAENLGSDKL